MRGTTKNRMAKMFIIVALLILMSEMVLALGVGPSRQFISFAPGQKIQGEMIIINDANEEFRAAVYPQGDLAEYMSVNTPLVDVASDDAMKRVNYEINFPTSAPRPGEHTLEVVVRQFPPDSDVADVATVSANLALISEIIVKVPYPGKFVEAKLFISDAEKKDTPTRFSVALYNFGTEYINDARAKINIYSLSGEHVAEFYTGNKSIKSKDESTLQAVWDDEAEKGSYKAIVTVYYDDKETKLETEFDLGTFVVDVSDISVNKFTLGDVAKFDIRLFNSWNTEIEGVYLEMFIEDKSGKSMTDFQTGVISIPAHEIGTLEAYWYTEGVAPGIYTVKLIVHYAGKMTQKEYEFEVSTNSITKLGAVGQAITEEEIKEVSTQGLIILLILIVLVLLIGMNVVWFYVLSKKMKEKGEQK